MRQSATDQVSGLSYEYILSRDSKPAHCFSAHVPGQGYVNDGTDESTRDEYNRQLKRRRDNELNNITSAPGYSEPGYTDPAPGKCVLFANWNCYSKQAADLLERAGYIIEWEDEWTTCDECSKAVRTSGDSYSWQRYYIEREGYAVCLDCLNWPDYLESIEDNSRMCCMAACNPAEHGYKLLSEPAEFANGWHPGQTDKPADILMKYQAEGKRMLVFRLSESSQFYATFEVWQRVEQEDNSEENQ